MKQLVSLIVAIYLIFCNGFFFFESSFSVANSHIIADFSIDEDQQDGEEVYSNQFENLDMFFPEKISNTLRTDFAQGEIIVKYKQEKTMDIMTFNDKYDITSYKQLSEENSISPMSNVYKVSFSKDSDIDKILKEFNNNPQVEYAEPNYLYQTFVLPNDTYFDQQWALNQSNDHDIDTPDAWNITTGNGSIVVAVIDTGVDWDHPDLADNIWNNTHESVDGSDTDGNGYIDDIRGWDFYSNDSNPADDHGHGSHCSGVIGAVGNNSIGIAGICWNCSIMPIKALSSSGGGYSDDLANAIYYAVDNGANIISMSWGGYTESSLITDAINYAHNNSVVLVAAAGNSNLDRKSYPAGYDSVIAVAATNQTDSKASFSNWGSWVDIAAPGVDIYSTFEGDTYYEASGTSMACPHVAGLAALLLSYNSSLTPQKLLNILKTSSESINSDYFIGAGRINAYRSLLYDEIPTAIINSSNFDNEFTNNITIYGTANGSSFTNYSLLYGYGLYPSSWTEVTSSANKVNDSLLGQWNTSNVSDGYYSLKLVVNSTGVLNSIDVEYVKINNNITTIYVGGSGPSNYSNIQNAVNDAGNGDSVYVYNGTYNESIMITSDIDISAESNLNTIIQTNYTTDYAFWVDSNRCNISNFYFNRNQIGVVYTSNNGSVIENNRFNGTYYCIYLLSNISGYSISPISLSGSSRGNTSIRNNVMTNCSIAGIITVGDFITIENNTVNGTTLDFFGIDIKLVMGSMIWGKNNSLQNNLFNDCYGGVYPYFMNTSTINNNNIHNCDYGLISGYSNNNTMQNNIINNSNLSGLAISYSSNNNTFYKNTISNTTSKGIDIDSSCENNSFYYNTIKSNSDNARDLGTNNWYNQQYSLGNYYDDYNGLDANNDGIGDTAYSINGGSNQDLYPLCYEPTIPQFLVNDDYNSTTPGWHFDHFDSIQDAIDNISLGGFIHIYNGTYAENIFINKSMKLIGENRTGTVIDGSGQNDVITINASSITIKSCTIKNSGNSIWGPGWDSGIDIYQGLSSITIQDNRIINNTYGINLQRCYCDNNTILSNFISNNYKGVDLCYCDNNEISNNILTYNNESISLTYSNSNLILNNSVSLCKGSLNTSICLGFSCNNTISNNYLNNSRNAISLGTGSNYNLLNNNNISHNNEGIYLFESGNPNNNILTKNNILNNLEFGIKIKSNNNSIYHNNMINNGINANDTGDNNTWYNTTLLEGNYWGDYTTHYPNASYSNGIYDTPYNITGGVNNDTYPLVSQFEDYIILIINDAPSSITEGRDFTVTVKTLGNTYVENALVSIQGDNDTTNSNGQATLKAPSVSSDTSKIITASKTGYTSNTTSITVNNQQSSSPSGSSPPPAAPTNNPPTANSGGPYSGMINSEITFDGSSSSDPDEDTLTYSWNFGDGNTDTGETTTYSYASAGTYTVTLTVSDGSSSNSDTTNATIKVPESLNPPVADAGGPYSGLTYKKIIFDGSKSYDNGTIVNYTWDFGDGTKDYNKKTSHIYNTHGKFTIKLIVTDDEKYSITDSTIATIKLDTDADGWSDEEEKKYGYNYTNSSIYPIDTDGNRIPDDYDGDDDGDGLTDTIEDAIGSNKINKNDVKKINSSYYLIDADLDGIFEKLYYQNKGVVTDTKILDDGSYLLDMGGDEKWDHVYDPASNSVHTYSKEEPSDDLPWLMIIIITIVIIAIISAIFILFKTGVLSLEKKDQDTDVNQDDENYYHY